MWQDVIAAFVTTSGNTAQFWFFSSIAAPAFILLCWKQCWIPQGLQDPYQSLDFNGPALQGIALIGSRWHRWAVGMHFSIRRGSLWTIWRAWAAFEAAPPASAAPAPAAAHSSGTGWPSSWPAWRTSARMMRSKKKCPALWMKLSSSGAKSWRISGKSSGFAPSAWLFSGLANRFGIDRNFVLRMFLELVACPHFNFSIVFVWFLFVFRLHLVTWNVGTASPPPDVASLLQLNSLGPSTDMYVIGWVRTCSVSSLQNSWVSAWSVLMWITAWEML